MKKALIKLLEWITIMSITLMVFVFLGAEAVDSLSDSHKYILGGSCVLWIFSIILWATLSNKNNKVCQCETAEFTRTVTEDFKPICGRCGKEI